MPIAQLRTPDKREVDGSSPFVHFVQLVAEEYLSYLANVCSLKTR